MPLGNDRYDAADIATEVVDFTDGKTVVQKPPNKFFLSQGHYL
jgi:hypothetical protein